ncbi:MAG: penicillin-binding protein 2 [Candidatus Liberibacter ctenarytainae]|uniref:Penicillin-binding protein 2 n=1 Tax=Candidatus Liberibacter ctenarytainae TaxID=2020335 RepID=A0A937AKB7_9HYPH|nr:penicillin-binding protein 2 [Candidatus Liberibacter ctenarytainae]
MLFPFVIMSQFQVNYSMDMAHHLVSEYSMFYNLENRKKVISKRYKQVMTQSKNRIRITITVFLLIHIVLFMRLIQYGNIQLELNSPVQSSEWLMTSRPNILDRNGEILAMDIPTFSLYAEPHKIISPGEIIEKLQTVLPDLDIKMIHRKLSSQSKFQWLRRHLTPQQQNRILSFGIPGLGFRLENRRFYPAASSTLHVVGYVDIDNRGIAGIEKFIDAQGLTHSSTAVGDEKYLAPIKLSLDLRVQEIVHQALIENKKKYDAKSAGTIILNVSTGEVVAMVSIPDHDPHDPIDKKKEGWLNRISYGIFEMGSIFKVFTIAMGIDSGLFTINDTIDTRHPIKIGKYFIKDFHPKARILTIPEILQYSSNIGAAKIADAIGISQHKDFLQKLGLLTKVETELPEIKAPSHPHQWKRIHSLTIAFGHGIATTPLQTAVAAAALVNGGYLISPTFMIRSRSEAEKISRTVLKKNTVETMRSLLRQGVVGGSGRRAYVPGFEVGGKTGTAQKVIDGNYSDEVNFNSFLAVFPTRNPRYIVLSFMDSPKIKSHNQLTAGVNVAPMVGEIIRQSATMLGVKPVF